MKLLAVQTTDPWLKPPEMIRLREELDRCIRALALPVGFVRARKPLCDGPDNRKRCSRIRLRFKTLFANPTKW